MYSIHLADFTVRVADRISLDRATESTAGAERCVVGDRDGARAAVCAERVAVSAGEVAGDSGGGGGGVSGAGVFRARVSGEWGVMLQKSAG